jgi:hypothetical protein
LHGEAGAQVRDTSRTRRDTLRGRGDTIPARRDTAVKRDTTRAVVVPVPAGEDSLLRRDSLARRDTTPPPRDTVKAPIATAEAPVLADPSGSFVWDRRDMFSTGALTVQDLLTRVPGVTTIRSGWIAQPMFASFLGDPSRVRVFLDGLELIELDPRAGGIWDLSQIPLWALDDIRIERGAGEIRIHMRSWRVDRTTPFTRTDVYTGDQSTNLYRGLFGRRYQHGEILQLAGQQHGTDPGRNIESSDQLGMLARVGVARQNWSIDAFMLRGDRNRGLTLTEPLSDSIPPTESTRSDAYLRAGWGRSDRGLWVQGIAHASRYTFGGERISGTEPSSADTSRFESQYVLTGGYARGPLRASVTQRFRAGLQRRIATPSARVGFETTRLTLSALAEGRGVDSTRRLEVMGVARPLGFVYLAGAFGVERPRTLPDSLVTPETPSSPTFARAEAGVRLRDVWFSGGIMRRDRVVLDAPRLYRSSTETGTDAAQDGLFAAIRGRIWKRLYGDFQGIQWSDSGGFYRAKYQSRSELYVSTQMIERFPTGNFHLLASAVHEYRSHSFWPDSSGVLRATGYRTISTLLQVRILQAEVFWNFRNILGERYRQIPGFPATRQTNIYGVRWEFWN